MNPALAYIDRSPEPYRSVMMHLQSVIEKAFPEMQLKYRWSLPFYYLEGKTMFCFFNYRKKFVDLGMPFAVGLSDPHGVLVAGEGRKTLRSMRFYTLEDIHEEIILDMLRELMALRQDKTKK